MKKLMKKLGVENKEDLRQLILSVENNYSFLIK